MQTKGSGDMAHIIPHSRWICFVNIKRNGKDGLYLVFHEVIQKPKHHDSYHIYLSYHIIPFLSHLTCRPNPHPLTNLSFSFQSNSPNKFLLPSFHQHPRN